MCQRYSLGNTPSILQRKSKDEQLFSMLGQNTGPLSRRIKTEKIEKKVVIGSAIQKHGFAFNYNDCNDNCSSSDEADSF